MDRNIKKLGAGALLALVIGAACKGDPTASLAGGVSSVTTSRSYVNVNVGDSVLLSAIVRDAANDPVPVTATPAPADAGIATVAATSAVPLSATDFYLKAVAYGTTSVTVTAGSASATINVHTYPASVRIGGATDSVPSGGTRKMWVIPRNVAGDSIGVSDKFTWSSSNSAVLSVDSLTGIVTAATPGKATISVSGPGSPSPVQFSVDIPVKPSAFAGTFSAASASPAQVITITKAAADPSYDADVAVSVGGTGVFTLNNTGSAISFVMPALGKSGAQPLLVTNVGANQLAYLASFGSATASVADPISPVGDTPGNARIISANGDFFTVIHGSCAGGGDIEGGTEAAGDKCDTYFKITNGGASPITLKLQMDWFDGASAGSDVDMIVCLDGACTSSLGSDYDFGGATSKNPEKTTVTLAAGQTYIVAVEMFDNTGLPAMLVRLRLVSGLP